MLTRRLFLGTTAGAAGLFGWLGRVRFRPQRRRLIVRTTKQIRGDNAELTLIRSGSEYAASLCIGGFPVELSEPVAVGRQRYWYKPLGSLGLDRDLFILIEVSEEERDDFRVNVVHVTTNERMVTGRTSMILYTHDPAEIFEGRGVGEFVHCGKVLTGVA